ncbi:hypothetical protein [Pectobacterium polaris]|uniref:hypothetical protein n=1 Tax=Pectobacterium polaris TaxID=2042057 RepID=UPI00202D6354|nr:hypothetical protein [Pectobacterium polaris]MCL6326880.1 hypothetical protein [Pectobacterium polaris]
MIEHILFVFEGAKTEKIIVNSLLRFFLEDDERRVIKSSFNTDIYTLYKEIKDDEDLDIFSLIKERNAELNDYTRDMFSQVFLFFDYDGHSNSASDDKIKKLLDFFCEETDKGKLYISYPMIESLKCISNLNDEDAFYNYSYPISECSNFKNHVSEYACNSLIHFNYYTKKCWCSVIRLHCSKANFLLKGDKLFPTSNIEQNDIFEIQKDNFIVPDRKISVLGAFPFLLLDYFGATSLSEQVIGMPILNDTALPQQVVNDFGS